MSGIQVEDFFTWLEPDLNHFPFLSEWQDEDF